MFCRNSFLTITIFFFCFLRYQVGLFDRVKQGFFSVVSHLDFMKVESQKMVTQHGTHSSMREYLESLKGSFESMESKMNYNLKVATDEIRSEFGTFKQLLQDNMFHLNVLKKPNQNPTVIARLQHGWEKLHDLAELESVKFQSKMRDEARHLKEKINHFLEQSMHESLLHEKALELKNQFLKFEKSIVDRTKALASLFKRSNNTVQHHVHRPFIECAQCGQSLSMAEFVNIYDPHHSLLLLEEDFWTDAQVEEFFEGWVEFANRLKLKCIYCGSDRWSHVDFEILDENGTCPLNSSVTIEELPADDHHHHHHVENQRHLEHQCPSM